MTETTTTRWSRAVLDDLSDRLGEDLCWGQCSFPDERLAELLDDPAAAARSVASIEEGAYWPNPSYGAAGRLAGHARAARRAGMSPEERAARDAEIRERLVARHRALGLTRDPDFDEHLGVLAVAASVAQRVREVS